MGGHGWVTVDAAELAMVTIRFFAATKEGSEPGVFCRCRARCVVLDYVLGACFLTYISLCFQSDLSVAALWPQSFLSAARGIEPFEFVCSAVCSQQPLVLCFGYDGAVEGVKKACSTPCGSKILIVVV